MGQQKKRRPPPANWGKPKDPDADWNEPDVDVDAVLAKIGDTRKRIADAPPEVWKRSYRFLEDVDRKLAEVHETIGRTRKCSPNQKRAVDGWCGGIEKALAADGGGRGDDGDL